MGSEIEIETFISLLASKVYVATVVCICWKATHML